MGSIVLMNETVSHQTKFTKLSLDAVIGAQVYTIGPLNIAYRDGDRSIVYMKFPSPEDSKLHFAYTRFKYAMSIFYPYSLTQPQQKTDLKPTSGICGSMSNRRRDKG